MKSVTPATALILINAPTSTLPVPASIALAGAAVAERFLEFFAANIRNPNTRIAYAADSIAGLRYRALIAVMIYSFARVGAVVSMAIEDYYQQGRRCWFRLHEKGGKYHQVPAHHKAEEYVDAYLEAAAVVPADKRLPLFRSINAKRKLTTRRMDRREVWEMIKRRARTAGLPPEICCHSCRATGITSYLENGGTLEKAQQIAAHESSKTTKLYDRTVDPIMLREIEKIGI
jgi:integrase